ncbi:MAG: putative F420-dependent oxidoreductase, partial [Acidimicrobiaceae bacterium]|nr:putative F420-dependent oxidoreductase [Acidimicrobiaceae bacterium]
MATSLTLGKFGVWTSVRQWPEDRGAIGDAAVELEELGFSAAWIGGSTDQFPVADAILAATTDFVAATGVTQVWINPAAEVAARHHELNAAHSGRFILGLGVGHAPAVTAAGQIYDRPLEKLASYLDELDRAEHAVPKSERVIAALRPKALALAGSRAAGSHPYNVPPEHTAKARAALGPGPALIPEHKVFFGSDPSIARAVGRRALAIYLNLPNYVDNLRQFGFDDADFAGVGSDRLVDTLVA